MVWTKFWAPLITIRVFYLFLVHMWHVLFLEGDNHLPLLLARDCFMRGTTKSLHVLYRYFAVRLVVAWRLG